MPQLPTKLGYEASQSPARKAPVWAVIALVKSCVKPPVAFWRAQWGAIVANFGRGQGIMSVSVSIHRGRPGMPGQQRGWVPDFAADGDTPISHNAIQPSEINLPLLVVRTFMMPTDAEQAGRGIFAISDGKRVASDTAEGQNIPRIGSNGLSGRASTKMVTASEWILTIMTQLRHNHLKNRA
ncbi:hypothetical protein FA13DRAFT_1711566 [Coprinellus micaceus]|uniref:Uncharacterized protein n=1 Tax=Coprinellus micaceus TaxID=71717 RepID=A0A4Y7T4D0_COPMI|nr:hypothetical protein FA13DRAFT_1711566 [Coprinellus micaceus]